MSHPSLSHRRRARRAAAVLAVVTVAAAVALATQGTSPSGPQSTAQPEGGMRAGLPLVDPPNLHARADGTLRLVAQVTRFDLAGRKVWGESYNGGFVGPTLQLEPGEHVALTFEDRLPVISNLHFHGMHISPSGSADNPFIELLPGHSFTYRFAVPAGHPQGTFWYHDHGMAMEPNAGSMPSMPAIPSRPGMAPTATVGADVESQIFAGLSGTILVGDDRRLLPAALQQITAHTLVLKDVQIDPSGHIVQNTAVRSIDSNDPTVRLVNGELRPALTMRPGETQLWRLANEGADIFYRLQLDGYRFTVIGEDGYPVAQITTASALLLPPGRRYDVLVTASAHPGAAWLRTLAYSNGPLGGSYPDAELLRLRVAGQAQVAVPMPSGAMPTAPPDLASATIAQKRTVILSENAAGTSFYINGKPFSPTRSAFNTPGVLGTVEQWTLLNTTGEAHPFHLHTVHFQVMSIDGVPQPYTGQVDIVPVPFEHNSVPGRVVIRIALSDFTGKWMFHCHISAHEDNGMMSYINVVD